MLRLLYSFAIFFSASYGTWIALYLALKRFTHRIELPEHLRATLPSDVGDRIEFRAWRDPPFEDLSVCMGITLPPFKSFVILDPRILSFDPEHQALFLLHEVGHVVRMSLAKLLLLSNVLAYLAILVSSASPLLGLATWLGFALAIRTLGRREEIGADLYAAHILGLEKVIELYARLASIEERSTSLLARLLNLLYLSKRERVRRLSSYLRRCEKIEEGFVRTVREKSCGGCVRELDRSLQLYAPPLLALYRRLYLG